jgi:tetratricopeptide (TPR) repeat protein
MGAVYRARDRQSGERVALKLLHPEGGGAQAAERFDREARLLAELRHPGIVSYVAHGEAPDGRRFLAMEWLDGEDLAARLLRARLSLADSLLLLRRVAEALEVTHARGVVHRDLKPGNVFLVGGDVARPKLLDFGVARRVVSSRAMTRAGALVGTPDYMAPEQARGQGELTPSADVFSLGCVLYECLTGQAPFAAEHVAAVLARILFEDPPPLDERRPSMPAPVTALVQRMLAKYPAQRFAGAGALLAELDALGDLPELDALGAPPELSSAPTLTLPSRRTPVFAAREQGLLSLVVASPALPVDPAATVTVEDDGAEAKRRSDVRDALSAMGLSAEFMADGSLVVKVTGTGSAMDQAAHAARAALAVKERWPAANVALATGRGAVEGRFTVGEVADRAVVLARQTPRGPASETGSGVRVDDLSARLLEARFELAPSPEGAVLSGEKKDADPTRPLLGKPTPCVGREQELTILGAVLDSTIDNAQAHAVLIVAPPGVGKSRLRHELLRSVAERHPDLALVLGAGSQLGSGSPFSLLGQGLRRLFEVPVGEGLPAQRACLQRCVAERLAGAEVERVSAFLGEMCGMAFPDEGHLLLRAARSDPAIMNEQIRRAFVDFLGAECARRPCLIVLEDLHWSDPLTVRMIDAALLSLGEQPLMVLALARPEVDELFPHLWEQRSVRRIKLAGLSKKASARLVAAVLGEAAPAETVARIVEHAAGNALFLEELIRAAVEGGGEQPETVMAMLQARVSCLEPAARRTLCAASVFGRTFWHGGVQALLGPGAGAQTVERWLDDLVQSETIEKRRMSRLPAETEYAFRHALVRDAAYALLTPDDQELGHRVAGEYLEGAGEGDAAVLAEHADRGRQPERALGFFRLAAQESYERNDFAGSLARAERAIACGASGEALGHLLALKAEVAMWRQAWPEGAEHAERALGLLPAGSRWWNQVLGALIMMAGNLGRPDRMAVAVQSLLQHQPWPDALVPHAGAVSSVIAMFSALGAREPARPLLARLEQLDPALLAGEALARGHLHFARCTFDCMMAFHPWEFSENARRLATAFDEAQSLRWRNISFWMEAMANASLGDDAAADRALRRCVDGAVQMDDAFLISGVHGISVLIWAERQDPACLEEAAALARKLVELGAMEATIGAAWGALARIRMVQGSLEEAKEAAEKALSVLQHMLSYRPAVYRTLVYTLLRMGRAEEARRVAEEGLSLRSQMGEVGRTEVALRLAAAEARRATGDVELAARDLGEIIALLSRHAGEIPDPAVRARFLDNVPENARARALAVEWGVGLAATRG